MKSSRRLTGKELKEVALRLQPMSLIFGLLAGVLGSLVQGAQLALGIVAGLLIYAALWRRSIVPPFQRFVIAFLVCMSAAFVSIVVTMMICAFMITCSSDRLGDSAILNVTWVLFTLVIAVLASGLDAALSRIKF